MDLSELRELLRSVVENDISEFEYEEAGVRIRIKRDHPTLLPSADPAEVSPPKSGPAPDKKIRSTGAEQPGIAPRNLEGLHAIASPLVGTFYNAPSPGAEPFVRISDVVREGTVLGIIEAMKLMNEIKSDVSGTVVDVLVENGQPVEYGQKLFLLQLQK